MYVKRIAEKDGFFFCYSICRSCNTNKLKIWREKDSSKVILRDTVRNQMRKYPEKLKARQLVNFALKKGEITKPKKCSSCFGDKKLDAHHGNYEKPLEVIWFCRGCHSDLHTKIRLGKTPLDKLPSTP